MTYDRYLQAEHVLNEGLIRRGLSLAREQLQLPPKEQGARMEVMRRFLVDCGEPQRGIPAVHVGGTSGKGSVCAMVAGALTAHGLRVGLHVTPYLQAATEKIWIGGRYVSSEEFADLVAWVEPVARRYLHPETRASIHGMASVTIAYEAFRRAEVDVMVYEVGCGGRFDLTSHLDTTVAVVTNVGLDHLISLGGTLESIAWHKAGIARPGAPLVTGAAGAALDVIATEAAAVGAPLIHVPRPEGALTGNRALARQTVLQTLARLGVEPRPEPELEAALDSLHLPARSERMPTKAARVILDGAHNPDKLAVAVAAALSADVGHAADRPASDTVAVIGLLGAKATPELLSPLAGRFDRVIATEPRVYAKSPYPAADLAGMLAGHGLVAEVEPDPERALDLALTGATPTTTILVVGSFYLAGNLRPRWYPTEQVVLQRTSWPVLD